MNYYYGARIWKSLRERVLRRDKYLCRYCLRYGKRKEATHVHHIVPADTSELLRYKDFNLISLCRLCHEQMHLREEHKLSKKGLTLVYELVREKKAPARVYEILSRA